MARSVRTPLIGALLAAVGLALARVLAFDVHAFHHADAVTLHDFMSLDRQSIYQLITDIAHVADPAPYGLIGVLLIGLALARGRTRVAVAVLVILLGTAVTTDYILKPLLAGARYDAVLGGRQVPDASFPSGHATASMALALCAILVASPRVRPYVAAFGAVFAIAVSYSFLTLGWHYPSDVLGGFLVSAGWAALAVAALRFADTRWPARSGRRAAGRLLAHVHARAAITALIALLVILAVAVASVAPARALDFVRLHTVFAVGAAAIALASVVVAGVLAAILRD
jgi:membrane-associated phospholipid phosphatase